MWKIVICAVICASSGAVACSASPTVGQSERNERASEAYSGIECLSSKNGQQWQVAAFTVPGGSPTQFGVCYWDGNKNVFVAKSELPTGSYVTASGSNCRGQAGTLQLYNSFDTVNSCPLR